jgi:hypothetical protein
MAAHPLERVSIVCFVYVAVTHLVIAAHEDDPFVGVVMHRLYYASMVCFVYVAVTHLGIAAHEDDPFVGVVMHRLYYASMVCLVFVAETHHRHPRARVSRSFAGARHRPHQCRIPD